MEPLRQDGQCRGVSTAEARRILIAVARRCVKSSEIAGAAVPLRVMARQELRRNLVSVMAVLVLLLGYSLNSDKSVATLALALLVLVSLLAGVLITVVSLRCETFELQDRVSEACEEFIENSPPDEDEDSSSPEGTTSVTDPPIRQTWGPSAGLQQGSALASVMSVFRNGLWQRVPKLLLVEGDIVALTGGDRVPCLSEVLRFEGEHDGLPAGVPMGDPSATSSTAARGKPGRLPRVFHGTGVTVVAGHRIELRPVAREHFNRKTMVPATSPALLLLCGDMRCYRLLETPLDSHLQRSLAPAAAATSADPSSSNTTANRRTSLLRERTRAASQRCYRAVLVIAFLAAAVGGLRLLLADGSRGDWALYLLVIPGQVAVCLLPMSLPVYLAAGEAVATARLLAFLELMLRRRREPKGAAAADPAPAGSASPSDPDPDEMADEFEQMDAEEREEALSGTSHTVSWRKARAYLWAVVVARWRCGTKSRVNHHHSLQAVSAPGSASASPRTLAPVSAEEAPAFKAANGSSSPQSGDTEAGHAAEVSPRRRAEGSTSGPGEAARRSNQGGLHSSDVDAGQAELGRGLGQGSERWRLNLRFSPRRRRRRRRPSGALSGGKDASGGVGGGIGRWSSWGSGWWCNLASGTAGAAIVEDHEDDDGTPSRAQQQQPQLRRKRQQQRQHTLLPVPMLGCGLVERLGAATTLCMLDEDTVCQPTSAIKEVFLVDSKDDDAGCWSGTVLDMHTQQGKRGVRFEDPHWWTHLPALKPIGLTCLLTEKSTEPRQQAKERKPVPGSSPVLAEGSNPPSQPTQSPSHRNQPGPALLDHVRDNHPMEHLADLSKAIGFCAADRAMFRERRRIHVINPKLAASRAMEDAHAQGQDESRRRGTIQAHLTGVMAQDRRSHAVQLLSQGNPSIVLGMCRDYWDGSAISSLPATLRKTILGMHQQWSLEDLDVVAFSYVPVPYTVNPFISSFNKHPDYLIHLSQSHTSSGKGRSSGGGGGGGNGGSSKGGEGPGRSPPQEGSPGFRRGGIALDAISESSSPYRQGHESDREPGRIDGSLSSSDLGHEPSHRAAEGGRQGLAGEPDGQTSSAAALGAGPMVSGGNAAVSAQGTRQPSISASAFRQSLSTNSSPLHSEWGESAAAKPDLDSRGGISESKDGASPGASNRPTIARMLTRVASEGCLDISASSRIMNHSNNTADVEHIIIQPTGSATSVDAVSDATPVMGLKPPPSPQQQEGGQGGMGSSSRSTALLQGTSRQRPLGAVAEGDGVDGNGVAGCGDGRSGSDGVGVHTLVGVGVVGGDVSAEQAKAVLSLGIEKGAMFLSRDNLTPEVSTGEKREKGEASAATGAALAALGLTSTTASGSGGAGGVKKGALPGEERRYSVDDSEVNIVHRAELHTAKVPVVPASGDEKMVEALWNLIHDQVFLGMAASFVPPKRDIMALIEDVEAAGVRFVYFSPRNMRRSKALAESMGIETDWNCAISLRPLEDSTQPDPHRMKSSYADWDVKARLPHGIEAIRNHIESVDNVPLLVSLFTDATPETTKDMLIIYRENDECTLAVGMSHRAVNADLFRAADLSFSVESLPLNQPLSSLPVASASLFSAIDSAFNSSIVGLHAALPLGDLARRGGAIVGLDGVGSIIIDLIREGRRLLTNTYQALSFLLLGSFGVALLVLVAAATPISEPMVLGGDHLIWTLWLVAPLLATSFLASPSDGSLMKRTPEKNDPKVVPIATRLVVHLLLRIVPMVLVCVALYVVLIAQFIIADDAELSSFCGSGEQQQTSAPQTDWVDMVWCLAQDNIRGESATAASKQAVDLVLVEFVLCLIAQSASFMYRTASVLKEPPWKNWVWNRCVVLILCLQVLHLGAASASRGSLRLLLRCRWEPLVAGFFCPFAVLGIAELLKRDDARVYDRYVTLLRLEFDTRLGMHSPR